MLEQIFRDVQETFVWFKQDGATCHIAEVPMDWLRSGFQKWIVSNNTNFSWAPRYPDLTSLDFSRGKFKYQVFRNNFWRTESHCHPNNRKYYQRYVKRKVTLYASSLMADTLKIGFVCNYMYTNSKILFFKMWHFHFPELNVKIVMTDKKWTLFFNHPCDHSWANVDQIQQQC